MTPLVPLALYGWPAVVLILFTVMPPKRAVIVGMLGSWMFLPMAGYQISGLPDITKMSITCVTVCVAALMFDTGRFARLRWSAMDFAMLAWIVVPLLSSVSAGYGAYDGFSGMLNQFVSWGMPYIIGRLYFNELSGLRELAIGIFVGGLVYVPFVLFEARMSPQLHTWIYGFHQHVFAQSKRGGGWRPTVFMQHGLAVAMFMGTAAVCGMWLWRAGRLRNLASVPTWLLSLGLFVTAAACRSMFALMLMLLGTTVLFVTRTTGIRLWIMIMIAICPVYATVRTTGVWDAGALREWASSLGEDRLGSLDTRLRSEDTLLRAVKQNLLFGGAHLEYVFTEARISGDQFISDGLWIITLGKYGVVGLVSLFGVLLGPPALFFFRNRFSEVNRPLSAGAAVLACVLILYAIDNLLNAMVNPIYLLASGGLVVVRTEIQVERAVNPAASPVPLRNESQGRRRTML